MEEIDRFYEAAVVTWLKLFAEQCRADAKTPGPDTPEAAVLFGMAERAEAEREMRVRRLEGQGLS